MKYQYLLFDLDGTLTDPEEGITTSVQYALDSFGIVVEDRKVLRPFIGPPLRESFMERYGMNEDTAVKAIAKYREWFAPTGIFQNMLYPGMDELLSALIREGAVLAVASSKPQPFVERILEHFGISQYFAVVVGSELDGRRDRKEEVVEEALLRLKDHETAGRIMENDNCVMIGDREFDIRGGKHHGLVTVGVSYGYAGVGELEKAGADYIADTVEELREILFR